MIFVIRFLDYAWNITENKFILSGADFYLTLFKGFGLLIGLDPLFFTLPWSCWPVCYCSSAQMKIMFNGGQML